MPAIVSIYRNVSFSKVNGEIFAIYFTFANQIPLGNFISVIDVTSTLLSGTDADPSTMIDGWRDIVGEEVMIVQQVNGGVAGNIYNIVCTVTDNDGSVYEVEMHLALTN
mgnify:FL=1